jgi:hypothetical protein
VDGRDKPGHDEDLLNGIIDSIFKEPKKRGVEPVIASEAKQSFFCCGHGLLRFARNDGKRSLATSPRNAPESLIIFRPTEGVGNAGGPWHPQPRVHL